MALRHILRLLLAGLLFGSALLTSVPGLLDSRLPTLNPPTAHADGPGGWPMFGHDPAHTRITPKGSEPVHICGGAARSRT